MRASCHTWPEIIAYLHANGVRRSGGSPDWQTAVVTHLGANRAYLGEARSGDHVNPGAHPALIDRGTWETMQLTRTLVPIRGRNPAVLAGLLRCANCRGRLIATAPRDRDGRLRRQYKCRDCPGGPRSSPGVRGWDVEPYIEARFFELCQAVDAEKGTAARIDPAAAEADLIAAEALPPDRGEDDSVAPIEAQVAVTAARLRLARITRWNLLPLSEELRAGWGACRPASAGATSAC